MNHKFQTTNQHQAFAGREGWLYVILGMMIMMCLGTVYSWSVFRVAVEKLFGIGSSLSGLPYLVSLAAYSVSMLLSGKRLKSHNPRSIIMVGGLLVSLGWILSGIAQNIYILTFAFGLITGAGVGIVYGVPIAVAARWFPEKSGLMVGIVLIGFGLSPLLTAPIANYLISTFGLMDAFKVFGISFFLLIALFSYPIKYPSQPFNSEGAKSAGTAVDTSTAVMVKTRSFIRLYFNFMIGTMVGLMMIGMTSNIGIEMIKLSPRTTAFYISLFAVSNGIGRPVFGWLTGKLSIKKAMLVSYTLILMAALMMLAAGAGSEGFFIMAFSLFWFNLGGWLAIAPISTLTLFGKEHYSQNYGVVFTAYGAGAIIGVLSSGWLKDLIQNYHVIFWLVIVFCGVGLFSTQRPLVNK